MPQLGLVAYSPQSFKKTRCENQTLFQGKHTFRKCYKMTQNWEVTDTTDTNMQSSVR